MNKEDVARISDAYDNLSHAIARVWYKMYGPKSGKFKGWQLLENNLVQIDYVRRNMPDIESEHYSLDAILNNFEVPTHSEPEHPGWCICEACTPDMDPNLRAKELARQQEEWLREAADYE